MSHKVRCCTLPRSEAKIEDYDTISNTDKEKDTFLWKIVKKACFSMINDKNDSKIANFL